VEDLELVPHNCEACGYWTATEVSRTRAGWMLQCTHCGNKSHERGSARSFRLFSDAIARFQVNIAARYPALARLTVRGAHMTFPAEN
jgi:hypothetical protein